MAQSLLLSLLLTFCPLSSLAQDLHELAKFGKHAELRAILNKTPSLVDTLDTHGRTPLHYACWSGHDTTVSYLIKRGASLEIADKDRGWTPLFFSVLAHRRSVTQVLLKAGADLHRRDKQKRTPIFELRSPEEIAFNKALGARFDVTDESGATPLSFACETRATECALLYLRMGLDANGFNRNGLPLKRAISNNDSLFVKRLLDHGADPNLAVDNALAKTDTTMISLLIARGARIEYGSRVFVRRLMYLYENKDDADQKPWLTFFSQFSLDPKLRNDEGRTLLHEAALELSVKLAHELIRKGADVNARDTNGDTPLHLLTTFGPSGTWCGNSFDEYYDEISLYDPQTGTSTKPQLMVKSEWHDSLSVRIARMLIDAGADVNARGYNNETPLLRLYTSWNRSTLKLLIERGADINAVDNHEGRFIKTVLWGKQGEDGLLENALKRGAKIYPEDKLLEQCIANGSRKAAQILVKYGAPATPEQLRQIETMIPHENAD